jgi:hypothetical protein
VRVVRQVSFNSDQWERVREHAESKGMPIARFMRFAVMQAVSKTHERRRVGDLLHDLETVSEIKEEKVRPPARAPARAARRAPGP